MQRRAAPLAWMLVRGLASVQPCRGCLGAHKPAPASSCCVRVVGCHRGHCSRPDGLACISTARCHTAWPQYRSSHRALHPCAMGAITTGACHRQSAAYARFPPCACSHASLTRLGDIGRHRTQSVCALQQEHICPLRFQHAAAFSRCRAPALNAPFPFHGGLSMCCRDQGWAGRKRLCACACKLTHRLHVLQAFQSPDSMSCKHSSHQTPCPASIPVTRLHVLQAFQSPDWVR